MFLEVQDVLAPQEVQRLQTIAAEAKFVDGRISNPANETKLNLQLDPQGPLYTESAQIVRDALMRCREFRDFTFPRYMAPPLLARYEPGMKYGAHYDAAYIFAAPRPVRSDISVTVFLAPKSSYEGGELVVSLGARQIAFKLDAGGAVFYPSTSLHEVAPVRSGQRLVAITFVQSLIGEATRRNLLYELNEIAALEGNNISWENRMRLEGVRANLLRAWSD
ncbi:MAG: Fe2+-dependent dioxygenase [Caulobacteraceae bacterium]